jgi:hypothetical protein
LVFAKGAVVLARMVLTSTGINSVVSVCCATAESAEAKAVKKRILFILRCFKK